MREKNLFYHYEECNYAVKILSLSFFFIWKHGWEHNVRSRREGKLQEDGTNEKLQLDSVKGYIAGA